MAAPSTGPAPASTGDPDPTPFSFRTKRVAHHGLTGALLYRLHDRRTHRIIRENVHRSPMLQRPDQVHGRDIVRQSKTRLSNSLDKTTHQLFLEPEGLTRTKFTSTA